MVIHLVILNQSFNFPAKAWGGIRAHQHFPLDFQQWRAMSNSLIYFLLVLIFRAKRIWWLQTLISVFSPFLLLYMCVCLVICFSKYISKHPVNQWFVSVPVKRFLTILDFLKYPIRWWSLLSAVQRHRIQLRLLLLCWVSASTRWCQLWR